MQTLIDGLRARQLGAELHIKQLEFTAGGDTEQEISLETDKMTDYFYEIVQIIIQNPDAPDGSSKLRFKLRFDQGFDQDATSTDEDAMYQRKFTIDPNGRIILHCLKIHCSVALIAGGINKAYFTVILRAWPRKSMRQYLDLVGRGEYIPA